MPVILSRRKRGNRGVGFDREIHEIAPLIMDAQAAGHISPKQIAAYFTDIGQRRSNGTVFTEPSTRRLLHRGVALGLPFKLQTVQESAARLRRSQAEREMEIMKLGRAARERAAARAYLKWL